MWVIAMFDLPVDTKEHRKRYRQFRDALLNDGFFMLQYSVYARPCPTIENATVHGDRVEDCVPAEGQVRVFTLTELQFARMRLFLGKRASPPEQPPDQLSFW